MPLVDGYLRVSPPDDQVMKTKFGQHTKGNGSPIVRLNIVFSEAAIGQGNAEMQRDNIRDYFQTNQISIQDEFQRANVITYDGDPAMVRGKLYPEMGVWVRAEDVDTALDILGQSEWVKKVGAGQRHYVGASLSR